MAPRHEPPRSQKIELKGKACLRPERQPGIAPPCEDDKPDKLIGGYMPPKPVTLPEVKWLSRPKVQGV